MIYLVASFWITSNHQINITMFPKVIYYITVTLGLELLDKFLTISVNFWINQLYVSFLLVSNIYKLPMASN